MKKHFVTFYFPGTIVAETTIRPTKKWHKDKAILMSKELKERHGALPYGFKFTCRSRDDNELDSKEIAQSRMYYLGGEVLTLEEIKKKGDPKDRILISNMECNNWDRVVVNRNSWKWTQPLKGKDEVLNI